MNIQQAQAAFIEEEKTERSLHTIATYRQSLKKFLRFLNEQGIKPTQPVTEITMDHFIDFPSWILSQKTASGKQFSKRTVGVYLAGVHCFLEWLILRQFITPSLVDTTRYQKRREKAGKKSEKKAIRMPKRGIPERMLEAASQINLPSPIKERNIALIEFLFFTGCRIGEAVTLTIGNLDIDNMTGLVSGKTGERTIYLNERVIQSLRNYWAARGSARQNDPVFSRHDKGAGRKCKPMSTSTGRDIVDAVAVVAGIDRSAINPHGFRHAFARSVLEKTGNIVHAQKLLGHKNINTTKEYLETTDEELRDVYLDVFGS